MSDRRYEKPGGVNPFKAVFDIKRNIEVARAHYGEDEKGIPVLFATYLSCTRRTE